MYPLLYLVHRAVYIFETFSQNLREREFAQQMIEKSIQQTIEWFTYTSYYKIIDTSNQVKTKPLSRFSSKF
jgi:hypothetical protein